MSHLQIQKTKSNLDDILKICSEYKNNDNYCYSLCSDISNKIDKSKKWLVVMSKLPNTIVDKCNEFVMREEYKIMAVDNLRIIKIIDIHNPHDNSVRQIIVSNGIKYEINETTKEEGKKSSHFVNCYSKILPAYYDRAIPNDYTGIWMIICYRRGGGWEEQTYKDGKQNGVCIRWNQNKEKITEQYYKNGKLDGPEYSWYPNGKKSYEYYFTKGNMNGPITEWDKNGYKTLEGRYKNDKKDGNFIAWDNGNIQYKIKYKKGHESGKAIFWHSNGEKEEEGEYRNGKKNKLWIEYYDNGQKKSEYTYNERGNKIGAYIEWCKNGNMSVFGEIGSSYMDDIDIEIRFYEDGSKKSITTERFGDQINCIEWNELGEIRKKYYDE